MSTEVTLTIGLFLINLLWGLAMWGLKQSYGDLKEQSRKNQEAIDGIKEHYFKKEDFKDFKEELWKRFDKLEDRLNEKDMK